MSETETEVPRTDAQALADAAAAAMWQADKASQNLGMRLERVAPGRATLSMPVAETFCNGHGTCHGGFIFTLADSAFAFACNSHNDKAVAQQVAITFIAPAFAQDRLTAEAVEVSRRGRSGLYDVSVTRQDGSLVASFRGNSRQVPGSHVDWPQDRED
ncbi:MAG: hydroxyphenylacetyl-CoA thioesterase PaaI [Rhodospirillales bacterium]